MGSAANINFVAPNNCTVQVTVGFEATVSGSGVSDFGSSDKYQVVVTQQVNPAGTFISSANSTSKPVALARAKYADYFTGTVTSGNLIQVDLIITTGTSHTMTLYNIDMRVEIVKK